MNDTTAQRWGIVRQSEECCDDIDELLPITARIIAHRKHEGFDEYIVEDSDMPSTPGQKLEIVSVLRTTDGSGAVYGYWSHMHAKRWLMPYGLWPCATD